MHQAYYSIVCVIMIELCIELICCSNSGDYIQSRDSINSIISVIRKLSTCSSISQAYYSIVCVI